MDAKRVTDEGRRENVGGDGKIDGSQDAWSVFPYHTDNRTLRQMSVVTFITP